MRIERFKRYTGLFGILLLMTFSSCVDEVFTGNSGVKGSYISIRGIGAKVGTTHPGTTPDDYVIETLRILAFDKVTGSCVSNVRYNAANGDIIKHPINPDSYDFVFLANEPSNTIIIDQLDRIQIYDDLDNIAYPERYFASDLIIPMIQEIKNVTVLPNGQGAQVNGGATVNVLQLGLDRLAVRLDVVLEAEDNLETTFTGITLENIPDVVPLTSNYTGTVERNVTRTFTKVADAGYFSTETPSSPDRAWARGVNRIVLPANELKDVTDVSKAVTLIVGMGNNYNPSCQLKIVSDPADYSLPINTKLDFLGIIKEPLEVNIKASEWDKIGEDWEISGTRTLSVSDIEVNITDFNGARIAFWSNMPVVRVLDKVYDENGVEEATNEIFNGLSSLYEASPNDNTRFRYDPNLGLGYMDIVLDRPAEASNVAGDKTYTFTLSASEDFTGTNSLQRKVIVHVKQVGKRYVFETNSNESESRLWSTPYVGAFWEDDEVGERVIKGIRWSYWWNWTVTVPDEYKDFIIISASPSFDPNIGTDNPGDPEHYPVVANDFRFESGSSVSGYGSIYFRIGLKSKNTTELPRYGYVNISYEESVNNTPERYYTKLYVRQGGKPDYLMRSGTISGASDYGVKFSPYNLTAKAFKDNPATTAKYYAISNAANEVDFVEHPTQAGAHFQWALPVANVTQGRRAYHPTNVNMGNAPWAITDWPIERINTNLFWGTTLGSHYELCPTGYGYYRPSDGPIDRIAINSNDNSQVYMSDWRMSLFKNPMRGDASVEAVKYTTSTSPKPQLYTPKPLAEVMYGFYADGFFDRRPITERTMVDGTTRGGSSLGQTKYKGVSLDNANAAYGGVLIFNENTNASIFFPAAGRRWHLDGSLEYASQTGYYWASSVASGWSLINNGQETGSPFGNIWTFQLNYKEPRPISSGHVLGYSIRCVKK